MRRGRFIRGLTVAGAVAALAAPGAFGATPQQIYKDFADNGRLDGRYTASELREFGRNASLQGYGALNPVAGVAGQTSPVVRTATRRAGKPAQRNPLRTARTTRATLPFTGVDLALMTAGGIFLLAVGGTLRRVARTKVTAK